MTVVTGFVVEGSARRLIPILVGFTRLRGYRQCDGFQIEEPESQLQQYVAKHCCGAAAMVSLRGSRGKGELLPRCLPPPSFGHTAQRDWHVWVIRDPGYNDAFCLSRSLCVNQQD